MKLFVNVYLVDEVLTGQSDFAEMHLIAVALCRMFPEVRLLAQCRDGGIDSFEYGITSADLAVRAGCVQQVFEICFAHQSVFQNAYPPTDSAVLAATKQEAHQLSVRLPACKPTVTI